MTISKLIEINIRVIGYLFNDFQSIISNELFDRLGTLVLYRFVTSH